MCKTNLLTGYALQVFYNERYLILYVQLYNLIFGSSLTILNIFQGVLEIEMDITRRVLLMSGCWGLRMRILSDLSTYNSLLYYTTLYTISVSLLLGFV